MYEDIQWACVQRYPTHKSTKILNVHAYEDTHCAFVQRYPPHIQTNLSGFFIFKNWTSATFSKITEYLVHSVDMFAWQDEVPIFEYVSIEDNAVVVQVLDAGFWESILNLPHSNKQPIALTCDAVCYSFLDCLLWDGAWAKSLNGSLSDTPLHTCFYLTDGITTLSLMTQILSQV